MTVLEKINSAENIKIRHMLEEMNSSGSGLSEAEVQQKLSRFGYNEIVEKERSLTVRLLSYFWGPIPVMIEIAAVLSLLVNRIPDFIVIFFLLIVNAFVGFWHDRKSNDAFEILKKKLILKARALRNGEYTLIDARELVPGDIIRIHSGDIVPADVRIINGEFLECDESSLTGNLLPVDKKLLQDIYSGSVAIRGEVTAVVTATGVKTFFGNTPKLIDKAGTKSHYEKAIIKIGNYLIVLAAFLVMVIFIYALFKHVNITETLRFMMVLTVASIPVALPAILTIILAFGAVHLAEKRAIVKRLAASEYLAGIDVLCLDKTGMLTVNIPNTGEPIPTFGYTKSDVLVYGALSSRLYDNDSIDNAVLNKIKLDYSLESRVSEFSVSKFLPFDPLTKRTEAFAERNQKKYIISKGAPHAIFGLIRDKHSIETYEQTVEDYGQLGYRIIAVAAKEENKNWELIGLIPLYDPLREESAEMIKEANKLGVDVKIVSGDDAAIVRQVSRQLGLRGNLLQSEKFRNIPSLELEDSIENSDGFTEVFPENKFTIVKILQLFKHLVGITGDGVNDAPALKKADCGIAVYTATDAAKSVASIVLTSPGISVIIDAIKESRKIFQRMNSYAIYRIAESISLLFFITLSILVFNFYPVTALMIVLIALLNDIPIMAISSDNVPYSYKPEQWNLKNVFGLGSILGFVGVLSSFFLFYLGRELLNLDIQTLQSFIFLNLAIAGHLTIFISRTRKPFWANKPSSTLLWSAIISKIIATLLAVYGILITPIGWKLALFVWVYAAVALFITDRIKIFYYNSFIPAFKTA